MHTTTTDYNSVITLIFIVVLVMEFGTVLLTVRSRSLFGFFVTMAVFSGTIGGILAINAARDWAAQFTPYQTIKGVQAWRSTKTLFWANIDGTFIVSFIGIALVCALLASLHFALHASRDATKKQSGAKRPSAKTAVQPESTSPRATSTEDGTTSKRTPRRRTETHTLA